MGDRILAEYLMVSRKLKQKYEDIKWGKAKHYIHNEEKYKPLMRPLYELGNQVGSQTSLLKDMSDKMINTLGEKEKIGDIALDYILYPSGQVDKMYGIYRVYSWVINQLQYVTTISSLRMKKNPIRVVRVYGSC